MTSQWKIQRPSRGPSDAEVLSLIRLHQAGESTFSLQMMVLSQLVDARIIARERILQSKENKA